MRRRSAVVAAVGGAAMIGVMAAALSSCRSGIPPHHVKLLATADTMAGRSAQLFGPRGRVAPPGTESEYAGDAACAGCHASEFHAHESTPHAHAAAVLTASAPRPEFRDGQTVSDEDHHIDYHVRVAGPADVIAAQDTSGTGKTAVLPVQWAFGSGHRGITYVAQGEHGFIEARISYYPKQRRWDFTPDQKPDGPVAGVTGLPLPKPVVPACFGCHGTVVVGANGEVDPHRTRLPIGCESCHGPAKAHVESMTGGKGKPVVPVHLTARQVFALCGECHRSPGPLTPSAAPEGGQEARFQGVALSRSRCFRESNGRLTCTTCHDPHRPAVRELTFYDAKCLSCHTPPHGKPCAVKKVAACVSCHMSNDPMPGRDDVVFRNHWIRRAPS